VDVSLFSVVYPLQRLLSAVCVASWVGEGIWGLCDFPSVLAFSFGSGVVAWGEPGTVVCVCGNGKVHEGHGVLRMMTR
jgi:hypothetical protein